MWIPEYQINLIGNMVPGNGYKIYVTDTASFTYPQYSMKRVTGLTELTPNATHLLPVTNNTGNNAILIITDVNLPEYSEIGIIRNNDELIGSGVVMNNRCALTIWGDDEQNGDDEGATDNEELTAVAYIIGTGNIIDLQLSNIQEITSNANLSNLYYIEDGIFKANAQCEFFNTDNIFNLSAIPNPLDENTTISYTLPDETQVSVIITDNVGNIISNLILNITQSDGFHEIAFNASAVPNGVYHCTLATTDYSESILILVIH